MCLFYTNHKYAYSVTYAIAMIGNYVLVLYQPQRCFSVTYAIAMIGNYVLVLYQPQRCL